MPKLKRKLDKPKPAPKPMGPPCEACGDLVPLGHPWPLCTPCQNTALQRLWLAQRGADETRVLHERLRAAGKVAKPAVHDDEEEKEDAA